MSADAITPLRRRMLEDMNAHKLNPYTQRSHISSCKRFWCRRKAGATSFYGSQARVLVNKFIARRRGGENRSNTPSFTILLEPLNHSSR